MRRRLLVAVTPRVLSDALIAMLRQAAAVDIVQATPAERVDGRFDLALVDAGAPASAPVVVEMRADGGFIVVREDGRDRIIELRDAVSLVELVAGYLALDVHATADRDA